MAKKIYIGTEEIAGLKGTGTVTGVVLNGTSATIGETGVATLTVATGDTNVQSD